MPGQGSRLLTQSLGVLGIAGALYDPGSWTFLRRALAQALDGNGESLMLLADFYADRDPDGHYQGNTNDTIYAVNCLDRPTPGLAAVQAAAESATTVSPVFGPYIEWSNLPCSDLADPAGGHAGADRTPPVRARSWWSARPTTRPRPTSRPRSMARELDSGPPAHLRRQRPHGVPLGERAASTDAVDAYFLHGTLPPAGTRCH